MAPERIPFLTRKEAAEYLGLKPHTLDTWGTAKGPPFYRLGRQVRYRQADLDAWLESRKQGGIPPPTPEPVPTVKAVHLNALRRMRGG